MSIEYTSPAWVNDKRPLLVAENLNALSNALVELANYANSTAFVYPVEYGETTYNDVVDILNESLLNLENGAAGSSGTNLFGSKFGTPAAATYNRVRMLAFGNGRFVALNSSLTTGNWSFDGIEWTVITPPSNQVGMPCGICYGGGMFVILPLSGGDGSQFLYSYDGVVWEVGDLGEAAATGFQYYNSIAFGAGRFVAVGNSGRFAYSDDGITWSAGYMPESVYNYISVVYYNRKFIAFSTNNLTYAYSEDGETWVMSSSLIDVAAQWDISAAGNGRYLCHTNAYSNVGVSFDGVTWAFLGSTGEAGTGEIAFGNGYFFNPTRDGRYVWTSKTGTSWTRLPANFPSTTGGISRAAFGNDRYVCIKSNAGAYISTNCIGRFSTGTVGQMINCVLPTATSTKIAQTNNAWSTHTTDILSYMQEVARHKV